MTTEAYVFEAIRTPRGKGKPSGALHAIKPIDLVVGLIDDLRARFPDLDEDRIDDLVLGVVTPVGDQGQDIARTAATAAGLPDTVGGVQLNRFCGSGLEAVNVAAKAVRSGFDELVIAGGVESMSRVAMGSDGGAMTNDPTTAYDNYFIPRAWPATCSPPCTATPRRRRRLLPGPRRGGLVLRRPLREIGCPGERHQGLTVLDHDQHMRPGTTAADLAKLAPAFAGIGALGGFDAVAMQKYHWIEAIDHVHTGGNSSGIVDGAALVLVGSENAGAASGLTPRARIVATATSGADPVLMFEGPLPAVDKALAKAGLRPKLRGTTERFASQLFGKGVTKTNALESLVIAGFVRGLSTRDVEAALVEAFGEQAAVSKSTVSRICAEIKTQFEAWSARRLDDVELDYLFLDGSHFKYHANASAEPVLAAWGIDTDGSRCSQRRNLIFS